MTYGTPELVIVGTAKGLILGVPQVKPELDPDEITYRDDA